MTDSDLKVTVIIQLSVLVGYEILGLKLFVVFRNTVLY